METEITATQLGRGLSDVLNRVRYRGESFLIVRNGEAIAKLAPAGPSKGITWAEFARRVGELFPVGDGFADDLEWAKRSQPPLQWPKWGE